jgi:hypothetical protein
VTPLTVVLIELAVIAIGGWLLHLACTGRLGRRGDDAR